jgi:hypothetical protein
MDRRKLGSIGAALGAMTLFAGTTFASPSAAELPPNWHIHDGQLALGPQHKGVGFFPTILGADYLQDPASCPDATDKAFLPSFGDAQSALLRAGICMTSDQIVHLRTVPVGVEGPEGWSSLTSAAEPGWVTYYRVTSR